MTKAALLVGAIIAILITVMYFTYSNGEIERRAQVEAQQETNKAFFDKMWKIINEQAQVADEYRDAFKDVYEGIIKGRYEGQRGGALMSWITEHNPQFDSKLYGKIQQSIEAQRDAFFIEQKKLVSYHQQHKVYITVAPNSFFVGGRGEVEITVITSEKTENVFEKGKEELEPLFKRK